MPVKALSRAAGADAPCRGFTLQVRVFVPKQGFRFRVIVDKTCVNNTPRWGLTFVLEKKEGSDFVEIVFVDYQPKPDDLEAAQGIEKMLETKVTQDQIKIAKEEIVPVAMELEGADTMTLAQKKRIETGARRFSVA